MSKRQIVLISGSPGSGKTSTLLRVLNKLAAQMEVHACLSEATARNSAGLALGFDLVLYESKGCQSQSDGVLCKKSRLILARRPADASSGVLTKPFVFEQGAFDAAEVFFSQTIQLAPVSAKQIFALDEIGPLELTKNEGFMPLLELLLQQDTARILLLTVRPACLDQLDKLVRLRTAEKNTMVIRVSLDEYSSDQVEKQIVGQAAMLNTAPG